MNRKFLGASMLFAISVAFIAGIIISSQITQPFVEDVKIETQKVKTHWVRQTGDANPGAGITGFFYFMVYPHQSDPSTAYGADQNLSNATAYEYKDSWDGEMAGETPWGTTVDYVMKVGVNGTDGYNVSEWEDDWTRANITIDFDYASDVNDIAMDEYVIGTDGSDYRWYHYVANNTNGFTITKGETFNCTHVTHDIYE